MDERNKADLEAAEVQLEAAIAHWLRAKLKAGQVRIGLPKGEQVASYWNWVEIDGTYYDFGLEISQ